MSPRLQKLSASESLGNHAFMLAHARQEVQKTGRGLETWHGRASEQKKGKAERQNPGKSLI